MSLSQGLYQRQLQKLSPQQIQLMKLLQVPTDMLEERIKEELEDNPALETGEEEDAEEFENDATDEFESLDEDRELDGSKDEYENIDISEYVQDGDDDIADYRMKDDNYPEADDNKTIPHKVETGFNELMTTSKK
jgi:RNA polymerase sigma-54 factor